MRFFRFVIILLSGFLHYHIYHHLAFLCQPIRPHPRLPGNIRRPAAYRPHRHCTYLVVRSHGLRRFSRSDGDWSGVSLSSARVIAMIGATHSSQLSAAALRAEFVPDA